MSDHSEREVEPAHGAAKLDLRRQAIRGFGAGAFLATAVFVRYALLPGTDRPLGLYVGLAVVLGISIGLLTTVLLVGWRVRRLAREK